MDFQKIREEAAKHVFDFYQPDKQGRGFICPLCGNGTGSSGDGVTFIKGGYSVHCFKCNFSGDIIALKAAENNCSYVDAARALAVVLGIADKWDEKNLDRKLFSEGKFKFRKDSDGETLTEDFFKSSDNEIKTDWSKFFIAAEKNLGMTDYPARRGLSLETARYFRLGFVKNWRHPKIPNAPESPRLIIPTSRYSYLARDVRQNLRESEKQYSKQKVGSSVIFNSASLKSEAVFIVEGEFDAMSFYEIGLPAVSLGSISNYKKLVDMLITTPTSGKNFPPNIFILAMDNDKGGRSATRTLRRIFNNFGLYNVISKNLYGDFKDANDALIADRKSFSETAKNFLETARKNFESNFNLNNLL